MFGRIFTYKHFFNFYEILYPFLVDFTHFSHCFHIVSFSLISLFLLVCSVDLHE